MYFLPGQSVNDLRYYEGNGIPGELVVMAYLIEPGEATADQVRALTAITWTEPTPL